MTLIRSFETISTIVYTDNIQNETRMKLYELMSRTENTDHFSIIAHLA